MTTPTLPTLRMAACSLPGQRSRNEDSVVFGTAMNGSYAVLADGAGGHSRGAEASQRAVACVERLLRDEPLAYSNANFSQIVRLAHLELLHNQGDGAPETRMHSTLVALWVHPSGHKVLWTHVGDSRLYRFRRGALDVVTQDDSVVQQMLQAGMLTAEQVPAHPLRNQITAALGMDGPMEPHTVARAVDLHDGDAFLLCSDGWWGDLDAQTMTASLHSALDPEQWLADMRARIEAAAKPRQDNFSAIAVWVGDPGSVTHPGFDDTRPAALLTPLTPL